MCTCVCVCVYACVRVCVCVCAHTRVKDRRVSELQVWDAELERSAESWSHACRWEHGPASLLSQIGQNLGVHWGRYS